MDPLDHPILKSGAPIVVNITNPSVCYYCYTPALPEDAVYCPSCGFPQRGAEKEQTEFLWKKRALHR